MIFSFGPFFCRGEADLFFRSLSRCGFLFFLCISLSLFLAKRRSCDSSSIVIATEEDKDDAFGALLGIFNESIFNSYAVVVTGTAFLGDFFLPSCLSEESEIVSELSPFLVFIGGALFCYGVAFALLSSSDVELLFSVDLVVFEGLSWVIFADGFVLDTELDA